MLLLEFIVEPYLSGVRVDSFLAKHLRNYTTWRLHRMVTEGLVTVDQIRAEGHQRLFRGQEVCIRLIEPPDKLLEAQPQPLNVVYEDPWLMVVDKPAGIIAHPVGDYQEATLANVIQAWLDEQSKARGLLRPGIVHRLDRMTSGLLVIAKDHFTHRQLSIAFQKSMPKKSYLALVEDHPEFETRTIDAPIGQRATKYSVLMSAQPDAIKPRPARTDVRVLRYMNDAALVMCNLHTGRNHQIRVHLASVGHPILGDEFYGPGDTIRQAPRLEGEAPTSKRHALHACRLDFYHPVLQTDMCFTSKPPDDFWIVQRDRSGPS